MEISDVQQAIQSAHTELQLPARINDEDQLKADIIDRINDLLATDFNRLISILYRLDINEETLKQRLAAVDGTNAAVIIAEMIIARQLQKIQSRNAFRTESPADENEKW
jgi:hypothetical protein